MPPFRKIVSKQLGELLVERGIITKEQLSRALAMQKDSGGMIGQILVSMGFVTDEQIAQSLTVQYGFPYLPLGSYDIDQEALRLIPEDVSRKNCLIAIDKIASTLTVAMANPLNIAAVEEIESLTGLRVQVFVSTIADVEGAINKYYKK